MLDISDEAVRASDPSGMMGHVQRYPDMVEEALLKRPSVKALDRAPTRVLVVGMGGSAIAGDYLASWLHVEGKVPLLVSRGYELPSWVDEDTLVLGFSYSGATEETLASFAQAKKKGAMLAAMSTGARLADLADKYGAAFAKIPAGGMMPRAALPSGFTTGALLLEGLGILKAEAKLRDAAKLLREVELDEAKRAAMSLHESIAAVYANGSLAPAARRFANQLNENAKVLAWWGEMPEMNHNELVGWDGEDQLDRFAAVFLRFAGEHAQARARYDFMAHLIQARGGQVLQLEAAGSSVPEQLLHSSMVGDAASVYLAALRKVDPTPVRVIADLKAKVGETGFAAGIE